MAAILSAQAHVRPCPDDLLAPAPTTWPRPPVPRRPARARPDRPGHVRPCPDDLLAPAPTGLALARPDSWYPATSSDLPAPRPTSSHSSGPASTGSAHARPVRRYQVTVHLSAPWTLLPPEVLPDVLP